MKKAYQVTTRVKIVNRIVSWLIDRGLGPDRFHKLIVRGRKTGKMYSLPVSLVMEDGQRWLVSPYGEPNWIKNARAAGEVRIRRGKESSRWLLDEIDPAQSAPVLKKYLTENTIVQPYFRARPEDSLEKFEREASEHPVFALHKADL